MRISDWSSDVCSSDLEDTAASTAHRHLRIGDLAIAGLAAQLAHGFDQVIEGMEPPFRQLPPVRVEREDAVQRDTLAAFEKVAGRARLRDAQGLKPQYRQPAEAVVEMGARQVRRREVGPRPEHLGSEIGR